MKRVDSSFLWICLFVCLLSACSQPTPNILGHWQGHNGAGTYLELIADADSVFLYDSYRKNMPAYIFPKGQFAYQQQADSFLVMHAEQNKPGVIRLLDEKNLAIGDGVNKIQFTLIDSKVPKIAKQLNTEESHLFRLAMIEREVTYICDKRQLSIPERKDMVERLTKDENGYYAWLAAQR